MGWTSLHKRKGQSTSDWFRNEYNLGDSYSLLDIAVVQLREVYIAVRHLPSGRVLALVFLVNYYRGYENFAYKDMDEFCGPNATQCPERILNLLSPLRLEDDPHGYARDWRQECRDHIVRRKSLPKISNGTIIDMGEELMFTDGAVSRYFIRDGKQWRRINKEGDEYLPLSGYYHFNHKKFDYTLVQKEKI